MVLRISDGRRMIVEFLLRRKYRRSRRFQNWGGRRDLNPRLSEPQSDALPAELLPPQRNEFTLVFAGGKAATPPRRRRVRLLWLIQRAAIDVVPCEDESNSCRAERRRTDNPRLAGVTKILQGRPKGFSGKGSELGVCWGFVEPVGPDPG